MKSLQRTPKYLAWQKLRRVMLVGLASPLVIGGQAAFAQSSEQLQLEEVLVTATRRVTDVQSTPVAVTAIDSEKFESMFAASIADVALLTPNFSAAQITGFNAAGFAMRGASQTDILVYWEPPVGVIVDDFVVPHMQTQLLDAYDIERVEVLRGPQGTLFGKNTTAGVVNVKTKKPIMNEFGADISYTYGDYGRQELKGAINIPVIDDTLAFRIAAFAQESDGYYENGKVSLGSAGGDYVGDGSEIGGDDSLSGRAKMLWTPTDNLTINLQYEYLKDRSDSPPAVNETDPASAQAFNTIGFPGVTRGDPLKQAGVTNKDRVANGSSSGLGFGDGHAIDVDGYYMNIDWTIGNFQLASVTGFREQESNLPSTYTGEVGDVNGVVSIFDANRYDERETFQQELRLSSYFDGPFNFVTGIFYQKDETSFNVAQYLGLLDIFGTGVPGVIGDNDPILISNNQDMESIAVYIDGTFDFSDSWTLSAGFRYTQEEKDFFSRPGRPISIAYGESSSALPFDGNDTNRYPCNPDDPLDCRTDSETWNEPTYRILLANQFTDNLYGYGSFSHGFKSGGYSDQAGSGLDVPLSATRYDPEEADSFEIGLKWDFWEGRGRFNSALFYVEYTDMQRATIVVTPEGLQETVVFNAAEVEAYGMELETTILLVEGLTLQANLGWLETEYKDFDLDLDLDPGTAPTSLSGNDVTRAPELNAGLDLTYVYPADWGQVRVIGGVYYEDESTNYYAVDAPSDGFPGGTPVPDFNTTLQSRTLFNASVTYTHPSNGWYVAAFGKNLTDERYRNASQYVGGLWTFSTYAEPRVWGVELGAKFGSGR
jgi:iron complex outermembrane receptor protein